MQGINDWNYAAKDEVASNFSREVGMNNLKLISGKVEGTLVVESNLPEKISILRLDTDWYESTKVELEVLFPRLESGGVLHYCPNVSSNNFSWLRYAGSGEKSSPVLSS